MNYDKADLSDPLLKINFKNFGLPKPGFRPTEHPGIKKRRFDKIIPVIDAKRRKSYCARSAGQMKKFPKAAKDPNSRLRQARRRWKC